MSASPLTVHTSANVPSPNASRRNGCFAAGFSVTRRCTPSSARPTTCAQSHSHGDQPGGAPYLLGGLGDEPHRPVVFASGLQQEGRVVALVPVLHHHAAAADSQNLPTTLIRDRSGQEPARTCSPFRRTTRGRTSVPTAVRWRRTQWWFVAGLTSPGASAWDLDFSHEEWSSPQPPLDEMVAFMDQFHREHPEAIAFDTRGEIKDALYDEGELGRVWRDSTRAAAHACPQCPCREGSSSTPRGGTNVARSAARQWPSRESGGGKSVNTTPRRRHLCAPLCPRWAAR